MDRLRRAERRRVLRDPLHRPLPARDLRLQRRRAALVVAVRVLLVRRAGHRPLPALHAATTCPTTRRGFSVDYPEHLSRGLALVKWWLLALPHYMVVGVFFGSGAWIAHEAGGTERWVWGSGLVGILVLVAAVVLAVTGRYPRSVYDLLLGLNRWALRVAAYASLMTDQYPPFRLDLGAHELLASAASRATRLAPFTSGPGRDAASGLGREPATAVGAPRGGWTAGRVVSVVVGAILALSSLGLLTAGFAGVVADRTMRDGGYLMTHVGDVSSRGYAAS